MSKGFRPLFALYCLLVIMAGGSAAAPLPPFAPVDVTGRIAEVNWVAAHHLEGIPGMSGSAGHDRTTPAHFIVRLTGYTGVKAEAARQMTRYIDWHALEDGSENTLPLFILLRINHQDRTFLHQGMTLRIGGYMIGGDEGGTWTSFEHIEILQ